MLIENCRCFRVILNVLISKISQSWESQKKDPCVVEREMDSYSDTNSKITLVFFSIMVNLWDKNLNIESELSMDYFINSARPRKKMRNKAI